MVYKMMSLIMYFLYMFLGIMYSYNNFIFFFNDEGVFLFSYDEMAVFTSGMILSTEWGFLMSYKCFLIWYILFNRYSIWNVWSNFLFVKKLMILSVVCFLMKYMNLMILMVNFLSRDGMLVNMIYMGFVMIFTSAMLFLI